LNDNHQNAFAVIHLLPLLISISSSLLQPSPRENLTRYFPEPAKARTRIMPQNSKGRKPGHRRMMALALKAVAP